MKNLSVVITGALERADEKTHELIHEATEAFLTELHRIEGVQVVQAQVVSPVKTTTPQPPVPVTEPET